MIGPAVHPVEAPPPTTEAAPLRVRMKDFQGMAGTTGALALRLCQFVFAAVSLCIMATTSDFPSVTTLRYPAAVVCLQCIWSLLLVLADTYALLVRRSFRNTGAVSLFAIVDGITSTLTFAAASSSAGITVLIGNDLGKCNLNHCTRFMSATAMAFLSWFAVSPSFPLNFWSLASRLASFTMYIAGLCQIICVLDLLHQTNSEARKLMTVVVRLVQFKLPRRVGH